MPGKRVQIDDATWRALDLLARERRTNFQQLADEVFADLLRKHDRPLFKLRRAIEDRHRPSVP
jgi:hypothetical protein